MRIIIIMMLLISSYGSPMSAQKQDANIPLEYTFHFETAQSQLPKLTYESLTEEEFRRTLATLDS